MVTPDPAMKALDPLVCRWTSAGRTVATQTEPAIEIAGTDTYEWLEGGFFLVLARHLPMRSFDNQGNYGVTQASLREDARAFLSIAADGLSMSASFERSAGGAWTPWMHMSFTR